MKKPVPFLALALVLLGAIALQQRAVQRLQDEQAPLRAARVEADQLQSDLRNSSGETNVADEIARLKEENYELLKLRNEIRQLRDRKAEFETVRAENQRLRAAAEGSHPALIKKEAFANAGLASPAATMQTVFWALQSGNAAVYQNCIAPATGRKFRPDEFARRSADSGISGFKIEDSQMIAPDRIGLAVRIFESRGGFVDQVGQEGSVILKKVGEEWRIEKANLALPGMW